ncbi:class I SAM-dependent methyltransferase [Pseudonocardia sp. TRM90224]|uniref:class I SAM-dependent methyltransferase n=1 Tax=Pseudonocardia sp. TRM90224 TaxID=2812678 RepID=UPI001E311571|nr:class I SAM-dependent methyltransferase [Pseudonocardia sp. TRM90224]
MSRQNIYDDPAFFRSYQELRSGEAGINAALEQPAVRRLLPDVDGLDVLDLGCGDGGRGRDLVAAGAASVMGVDASALMLELARTSTADRRIRYRNAFVEDLDFPDRSFDLILAGMVLHYIDDLDAVLARLAGWLRPGGRIVASMEHPFTSGVGNYADEGQRLPTWLDSQVVKYHRKISSILDALDGAGVEGVRLLEPTPTAAQVSQRPELEPYTSRPPVLVFSATKSA